MVNTVLRPRTNSIYDDLNRLVGVAIQKIEGSTVLSQAYTLNDDGTRKSLVEVNYNSYSPVTTTTSWSYDALQRLTGEAVSSTQSSTSYTDSYTYDLDNNRLSQTHVGPGGGVNDTTTYAYNGDDELTSQTDTYSGSTTTTNFTYDLNGSLTSSDPSTGSATTYTYDVRNRSGNPISAPMN